MMRTFFLSYDSLSVNSHFSRARAWAQIVADEWESHECHTSALPTSLHGRARAAAYSECGAGRMACDRGSGRAACDKAKVLAVAIASGAAAASALLSMPTDRSEPVVVSCWPRGRESAFLRRSASRPLVACRAGEGSARNQRGWRSLEAVSLIGIGRPMMVIDLPAARAE